MATVKASTAVAPLANRTTNNQFATNASSVPGAVAGATSAKAAVPHAITPLEYNPNGNFVTVSPATTKDVHYVLPDGHIMLLPAGSTYIPENLVGHYYTKANGISVQA